MHRYIYPLHYHTAIPIFFKMAPCTWSLIFATQNFVSPRMNISPGRPKQKFAMPPGMTSLPMRIPPGDQTLIPSPHPLYTLPATSHLMPSGWPAIFCQRNDLCVTAVSKIGTCVRHGEDPSVHQERRSRNVLDIEGIARESVSAPGPGHILCLSYIVDARVGSTVPSP
jgi:hypothetical protein